MIKLLIIDPANFIGGAELFTIDLLSHFNLSRFKPTLVTSGNPAYLKLLPEFCHYQIADIPRLKPINLKNFLQLRKTVQQLRQIIRQENPDLILSNSVRSHICAGLAAKKEKKPIIWYLHDYTFPSFLLKRLIKIPATVITNSDGVLNFVKKQISPKYHHKLKTIPNGIDLEKCQKVATLNTLRTELGLKIEDKIIGIIGRLDTWKGQDFFIRAAAKVLASLNHVYFVIIGDASAHDFKTVDYKRKLEQLVLDLGVAKSVFFLGFRPNIYELIKELDLLVHASTDPEPFGRTVLEGMALKTPVIASNLGGPVEIIDHQKNGFLVDPKDTDQLAKTMVHLLQNEPVRQKMTRGGYLTVQQKFDLKTIVRRLEKIYEQVVQGKI